MTKFRPYSEPAVESGEVLSFGQRLALRSISRRNFAGQRNATARAIRLAHPVAVSPIVYHLVDANGFPVGNFVSTPEGLVKA